MKQTFVHNVIDPSINELKNTSAFHLMTQINTNIILSLLFIGMSRRIVCVNLYH